MEHPIIMSTPMVQSTLNGTKTLIMKGPGTIYRTKDNQIVVAYNNEQIPQYSKYRRAFVRYFENESCIEPKMIDGKKVIGVQLFCELTQIGFVE